MQTLEQISASINTAQALGDVVRTMKALSAVSIHQYEQAADAVTVYYETVELGLAAVLRNYRPVLNRHGAPVRLGVIVLGSDQGLCGRFNVDVCGQARTELQAADPEARILVVGERAASKLAETPGLDQLSAPASVGAMTQTVERILDCVDTWQHELGINSVRLVYNVTDETQLYETRGFQLLPVQPERFEHARATQWPTRMIPLYTMDQETLLRRLVRQYFFVSIFRAVAKSVVAEHTARLAVLTGASRNIDEYLEDLQGAYRQRRQAGITAELMDLFGGFEALGAGVRATVGGDG